jgi:hypothetical protein
MESGNTRALPSASQDKKEIVLNLFAVLLSAILVAQPVAKTTTNKTAQTPNQPVLVTVDASSEVRSGQPAQAQPQGGSAVGITVGQPPFGFNVIPNSTRRIFATVTNGSTNQVSWALKSGTATISSNSGSWIDVVAGNTGTSCSFTGTGATGYGVTSSTQFTIEATAVDDVTKKADITFNVCNPTVQVSTIPFYRTLYANQMADVQSLILGAVDQTVHWAITSQPSGGDGGLSDSTSRDTVFSATVPGRYTLTATSNADPRQTSTSIMYVTGHRMPYRVTPNQTVPVDCTVDPSMLGTVYEVGPSQTFKTLASIPFPTIMPGSTVRIHNEDTSGTNPTTYHEYFQISQPAAPDQPVRVCGVPDSRGNLPVLDGANARGRSDASDYSGGLGVVDIMSSSNWSYWPAYTGVSNIVVEGLSIRHAYPTYNYVTPEGATTAWSTFGSCIRVQEVHNAAFVGNDLGFCGNGIFSEFTGGSWGTSSFNLLIDGNNLHDNGVVGDTHEHQLYLQAWGEVVQFNRIDNYTAGASGSNLKSRGIQDVIRYNYFGDGAARDMDLGDVQDAPEFMSFEGLLGGGAGSSKAVYPAQNYPADTVAAWQEAWNWHFAYGNIYQNSSSGVPIHFAMDASGGETARKGSLFWYNNTFYETVCSTCSGQQWTLFDTSAGGGSLDAQVEFQNIQAYNNIIWLDDPTRPVFNWNDYDAFIGTAGKNLMTANWGSNDMTDGGSGTGWATTTTPWGVGIFYQNATEMSLHLTGFNSSNLLTTSSIPFDPNTWTLKGNQAGSASIPSAACEMPVRFAFLPSLSYAVPRIASPNLGATDTATQTATEMNAIAAGAKYNTRYSNCR